MGNHQCFTLCVCVVDDWLRNEVSAVSRSYRKKKYTYVGYSQVAGERSRKAVVGDVVVLVFVDQSG